MNQTVVETEVVKIAFSGIFPATAKAISSGTEREKVPALAIYNAFKQGWERSRSPILNAAGFTLAPHGAFRVSLEDEGESYGSAIWSIAEVGTHQVVGLTGEEVEALYKQTLLAYGGGLKQ